ncbi:MAG TPA: PilZ domain-containing protein [Chloroflexota bacterium]|nr:PilZ domain-containing protein [Chloroflexota bacterium]
MPPTTAGECDELRELAELSDAAAVVTLPADWETPPFALGQTVMVTVGTGSDGIMSAEAFVDRFDGPHGPQLTLRLQGPLRRQQRRFDVRLPLDLPARRTLRLQLTGEPQSIRSRVLDISAGGLMLQTRNKVDAGDRLVVAFTLPGDGLELRVAIVVRYCRQPDESRLYEWELGCQFQVLRPADRERIARYIFGQQREVARRRRAMAAT